MTSWESDRTLELIGPRRSPSAVWSSGARPGAASAAPFRAGANVRGLPARQATSEHAMGEPVVALARLLVAQRSLAGKRHSHRSLGPSLE